MTHFRRQVWGHPDGWSQPTSSPHSCSSPPLPPHPSLPSWPRMLQASTERFRPIFYADSSHTSSFSILFPLVNSPSPGATHLLCQKVRQCRKLGGRSARAVPRGQTVSSSRWGWCWSWCCWSWWYWWWGCLETQAERSVSSSTLIMMELFIMLLSRSILCSHF